MGWSMYESGRTLGEKGPQSGRVLRDEAHVRGARLTLEEGTPFAPYVITCVIDGSRLEHVYATDASGTAARVFNAMKSDIDSILALPVSADGGDVSLAAAIEEFVHAYR